MIKPSAACHETCKPITGSEECHCIKCHQSFYTAESFFRHRTDPDVPDDEDPGCWKPESIGLTQEKGMWATPEEHAQRKFYEERAEKARNARG